MKKYIESFLLMIQFMTRIPVNLSLPCENEDFKRGTVFLPLVGGIIGGIQWLVYYLLIHKLPANITAAFVVLSGVLLTGALHLDGLGDTCDGFFSFKSKDKIIEIMKDSRIGTYSCIALIFDILIKVTAISCIRDMKLSLIIVLVPMIGRASIVTLACIGKAAKKTGTGNLFIDNSGKKQAVAALSITAIVMYVFIGHIKTLILMLSTLILVVLFNKFCMKKIGGITGDSLGAGNELVEMMILVLFIGIR